MLSDERQKLEPHFPTLFARLFRKNAQLRYNVRVNEYPNSWLNSNTSHVSPAGDISPDMTRYSLTIEDASWLFAEAGVPRAPRTITRFCALGDLDCIRVETEKNFKYLIDPKSVEKRIEQLKQALHFTSKTSPDMSRHVETINETQPDMSRHEEQMREALARDEELEMLRERVEELETENIHLKISKQANETVINQMTSERKEFFSQMREMSFQLGEATAKLQLLDAPRPEREERAPEARPVEQVSDAIEVPSEPTPPQGASLEPTPAPSAPEPEKRGFLGRLFGR
jgi:hypothetical protein